MADAPVGDNRTPRAVGGGRSPRARPGFPESPILGVEGDDAASSGLTGDTDTIGDGFVLVLTILFWSVVLDAVSYRWPRLGKILKARPKPLIEDGRLNRRVMRRELMTDVEVFAQLRLHGIEDLERVHAPTSSPTA